MKNAITCRLQLLLTGFCLITGLLLTSCDDGSFNHVPPQGKGSIIIDNRTGNDAEVYLGGVFAGIADSGETTVFDLEPGVYRVVLAEKDGSRNYWSEADVLAGRLTILDVNVDYSNPSLYNVTVDFEEP